MQSYINDRLEIHRAGGAFPSIIYGTTGSPLAEWETEIIDNDGGYRKAFKNREQAIGKWDVGSFTYSLEEWEYLMNFFIDKRGSAIAFRYKDYSDFEAVGEQIGVGDGIKTTFYFTKLYGDYLRDITQLVSGTVQIYVNGTLQTTGFTIYHDFGIVVFDSAVANAAIVTANFEFDVRVRFETDTLPATLVAFQPSDGDKLVDVGNMPIIETLIGDRAELKWACSNGECYPALQGVYDTRSECIAALIPPPFTGGQCVGVNYLINFSYLFNGTPQNRTTAPIMGKIATITFSDPVTSGGGGFYKIIVNGVEYGIAGGFADINSGAVTSLERQDGLPDDCGSLPSTCPL